MLIVFASPSRLMALLMILLFLAGKNTSALLASSIDYDFRSRWLQESSLWLFLLFRLGKKTTSKKIAAEDLKTPLKFRCKPLLPISNSGSTNQFLWFSPHLGWLSMVHWCIFNTYTKLFDFTISTVEATIASRSAKRLLTWRRLVGG